MPGILLDLCPCREGACQENPASAAQAKRKLFEQSNEIRQSALPRKASKHKNKETVPQTDTGG